MKGPAKIHLILSAALLLAGCGTQAVYTRESFSADSPFRLKVDDDLAIACESARRSLLGQGYLVDFANTEQVKGHKAYRIEGKANTFIEMNIACVPDGVGSTLYATGVLSTYDLKKSSNPASVGLAGVGSISLPIGQSADSLVKIAEETIGDRQFYRRFFAAVEHTLDEMRAYAPTIDDTASETAAPAADIPLPVMVEEQDPDKPVAPLAEPATTAGEPAAAATLPAAPESEPGRGEVAPEFPEMAPSLPYEAPPVLPDAERVPPADAGVEPPAHEETSGLPDIEPGRPAAPGGESTPFPEL